MFSKRIGRRTLRVEALEPRCVLSLIFGVDDAAHDAHDHEDQGGGALRKANGGGGGNAPAIRLDLVALHEFGHSLGLQHTSDPSSIMYAYYNSNYNTSNLASDSVVPTLWALYADVNASAWKDSSDADGGATDGDVDLTYSFVPDGARMDKGTSTTFATFDRIFGAGNWQSIFAGELGRWAGVSGGKLNFAGHSDDGLKFNYVGAAQNDPAAGDIRIAAHRFDGASKVLAHAYFPPPNGSTAAGDAHFDQAENWVLSGGLSVGGPGGGGGSGGNLVLALPENLHTAMLPFEVDHREESADSAVTSFSPADEQASVPSSPSAQVTLAEGTRWLRFVTGKDESAVNKKNGEFESAGSLDPTWLDALALHLAQFNVAPLA